MMTERRNIEVREPKASLRHNQQVEYISHRFAIKDGISSRELMNVTFSQNNRLLDWLTARSRVVAKY